MSKFFILALGLLSITAAQAASLKCDGGISLNLSRSEGKVSVAGLDGVTGTAHGDEDSNYKPRAGHEGSTRYELTDACDEGSVYAILDKSLSEGKSGKLTIENACDTDGGAPMFNVYDCSAE
jgi:hypothetical protein